MYACVRACARACVCVTRHCNSDSQKGWANKSNQSMNMFFLGRLRTSYLWLDGSTGNSEYLEYRCIEKLHNNKTAISVS